MSGFTLFDPGASNDWSVSSRPQSVASVASVARDDKMLGTPTFSAEDMARAAVRDLAIVTRPDNFAFADWATLMADLQDFTETALPFALSKGWTLLDLFSVPRSPGHRRVDHMGLVPMLRGRAVRIADSNRATIINRIGPPNTFYRHAPGCSQPFDRSGGALIWDVYLKEIAS